MLYLDQLSNQPEPMDIMYQSPGVLNWGKIHQHQENFNKKSICICIKRQQKFKKKNPENLL